MRGPGSQGLLGVATFTLVLPIPGARPLAGAIVLVALLQTAIVFGPEIVSGIGTAFQDGSESGSVDELITKSTPRPKGKGRSKKQQRDFDERGGIDRANQEFDRLGPRNVQDRGNGVRTGELPGGESLTVRPQNAPSIDVFRPDGTRVTIRF